MNEFRSAVDARIGAEEMQTTWIGRGNTLDIEFARIGIALRWSSTYPNSDSPVNLQLRQFPIEIGDARFADLGFAHMQVSQLCKPPQSA
jgi:hypothetical protein